MRWAGHIASRGEMINTYQVFVGKPKENRPPAEPRHRLEDNIRMDLRE
jgi:hypothetical protein